MRYLLIPAAFLLMPALGLVDAAAAGPPQPIVINNNNYIINDNNNCNQSHNIGRGVDHRRSYGYGYGYDRYPSYHRHGSSFETHNEAVARIMAIHSRDRTYYHPRSYYNSPSRYGW